MAFMLPALGGLLGSMLFKQDGGKIEVPAVKSGRLSQMFNPQFPYVKNPYIKKSGGKIKRGKGKHKKK
jgi:hypothetical protein